MHRRLEVDYIIKRIEGCSLIYIIRHGKTELNKSNVLQGRSDYPLNDEGIKQAEEAAFILKNVTFDYVFSSPLIRSVRTAEIVVPQSSIQIDERLIEMDYGSYEGVNLMNPPAEIQKFFSDFVHNEAPEGMEQLSSVVDRAGKFIEDIRKLSGNILISTHAIAMKGLLEYLTPDSNGSYWSKYIGNCDIYVADNKDGQISVPRKMQNMP